MDEFHTSLVREKIVFIDDNHDVIDDDNASEPEVVRSNRVFLHLKTKEIDEKLVIRAQNMHTTLKLAARIMHEYFKKGAFTKRDIAVDWRALWDASLSSYETEFNPDIWASVYLNGEAVFRTSSSATYADVIEKCALLTAEDYDATMEVTESALKKVGKAMRINHSSNVAAVFTDTGDHIRCGIIHRSDTRDSTFNFTASGGNRDNRIVQTMGVAAAFLEALNLTFFLKMVKPKLRSGKLEKSSDEFKKGQAALARQAALSKTIHSFEDLYDVNYRPEKPNFFDV